MILKTGNEPFAYYDAIVLGNSAEAVYKAAFLARHGNTVALVTEDEMLCSELSLQLDSVLEKSRDTIDFLKYIGIQPIEVSDRYISVPQGIAAKDTLNLLRSLGVSVFFLSRAILRTDHASVVIANKFGSYLLCGRTLFDPDDMLCERKLPEDRVEYTCAALLSSVNSPDGRDILLPDVGFAYDIAIIKCLPHKDMWTLSFKFLEKAYHADETAFGLLLDVMKWAKASVPKLSCASIFKAGFKIFPSNMRLSDKRIKKIVSSVELPDLDFGYAEPKYVFIGKEKYLLRDLLCGEELDESLGAKLPKLLLPVCAFRPQRFDVAIAGIGTAGIAALAAAQSVGVTVAAIDAKPMPGGTRTLGMVSSFWHGYTGGYAEMHKQNAVDFFKEKVGGGTKQHVKELLYDLSLIYKENTTGFLSSIVFGAEMTGKKLTDVLVSTPAGVVRISARSFIDATGDADVAVLAGCEYHLSGDRRDGVPQGYSIWGDDTMIDKDFENFNYNIYRGDDDCTGAVTYGEFLRCSYLSQQNNNDLGYSPMLTVRESRHISGEYTLNIKDILLGRTFDDTAAVALCVFDTHGCGTSEAFYTTLFGSLDTREPGADWHINIPLRCFIPAGVSGLAVVGKALSATRDAGSLVRMNPDILNAGYSVGLIMSESAKVFGEPSVTRIKRRLTAIGILPKWEPYVLPDAETLAKEAAAGNVRSMAVATVCPQYRPQFESIYSKLSDDKEKYNMGIVLAALSSSVAADDLISRLKTIVESGEMTEKSRIVSTLCVLLGDLAAADGKVRGKLLPVLTEAISKADAGTKKAQTDLTPYQRSKVHTVFACELVPNFKMLISLASAAEKIACAQLADPLMELSEKENIKTPLNGNIHSVQLYLRIIAAAARCGSVEAAHVLAKLADDDHVYIRHFVNSELCDITGINGTLSRGKWGRQLKNTAVHIAPLVDRQVFWD